MNPTNVIVTICPATFSKEEGPRIPAFTAEVIHRVKQLWPDEAVLVQCLIQGTNPHPDIVSNIVSDEEHFEFQDQVEGVIEDCMRDVLERGKE